MMQNYLPSKIYSFAIMVFAMSVGSAVTCSMNTKETASYTYVGRVVVDPIFGSRVTSKAKD